MKNFLLSIFKIPEIEKRPEVNFLTKILIPDYKKDSVISYIDYKCVIFNIFINIFIIALFWFSYLQQKKISVLGFEILVSTDMPVQYLATHYMGSMIVTLPFLLIIGAIYIWTNRDTARNNFIQDGILLTGVKKIYTQGANKYSKILFVLISIQIMIPVFLYVMIPGTYEFFYRYDLYNYYYDFRAQNLENFFLYSVLILLFSSIFIASFIHFLFLTIESIFFKDRFLKELNR